MNKPSCKPATYQRSGSKLGTVVALAVAGVLLGGQYQAAAWLPMYSDNFNSGPPDTGWNHWDPINTGIALYNAGYGLPLTASPGPNLYQFKPDGSGGQAYNLTNPPFAYALGFSGDYEAFSALPPLGPARTVAYRSDNYTNFNITADLLPGWAGGINPIDIGGYRIQIMGLLARMQTIELGTTAGYAFSYGNGGLYGISPYGNFLAIYRARNDLTASSGIPGSGNAESPGNCEYHFAPGAGLDNSKAYRFQFIGKGTHLQGRVYELPNTNTPIVVLDANTAGQSTIYTNGPCGIMGLSYTDDNLNQYVGPLDMTWDNYSASAHTPYEIRDNFNSQSDGVQSYPPWSAPPWVHYDPRGDGGLPAATYSFPNLGGGNYGYEINAPLTPTGYEPYGPARAGSIRQEVSYSDFYVSADVSNWNPVQLVLGLVGRGNNIGPGTTSGYVWTYEGDGANPITWPLWISKLTDEIGSGLSSPVYNELQPSRTYRMSFKGKGNQLTGRIMDLSTGSTNIVITAADSANTYPEGYVGLLVAASQSSPDPFAVNPYVTFDNFYADTAEPTLEYSTDGAGRAVLKWPATLASIWTLQSSSSLAPTATWTEIPASDGTNVHYYYNPATGLNSCTNSPAISDSTPTYFRLQRLDPLAYP
jgi:hypothetical protein